MSVYLDKKSGKWKIGSNGLPVYETEKAARTARLNKLVDRIFDLIKKRGEATR